MIRDRIAEIAKAWDDPAMPHEDVVYLDLADRILALFREPLGWVLVGWAEGDVVTTISEGYRRRDRADLDCEHFNAIADGLRYTVEPVGYALDPGILALFDEPVAWGVRDMGWPLLFDNEADAIEEAEQCGEAAIVVPLYALEGGDPTGRPTREPDRSVRREGSDVNEGGSVAKPKAQAADVATAPAGPPDPLEAWEEAARIPKHLRMASEIWLIEAGDALAAEVRRLREKRKLDKELYDQLAYDAWNTEAEVRRLRERVHDLTKQRNVVASALYGAPLEGTEAIADSLDEPIGGTSHYELDQSLMAETEPLDETVEDLSEYEHERTGPSAAVEWNQTRRLLCARRTGDRRVGLGLDASDRRGATWWQRLTNVRYRTGTDRRKRDE